MAARSDGRPSQSLPEQHQRRLRLHAPSQEETGISRAALQLVRKGRPQRVDDGARAFLVHPFLFSTANCQPEVRLNWENAEWCWALPDEVGSLDTVPALVRPWLCSAAVSSKC